MRLPRLKLGPLAKGVATLSGGVAAAQIIGFAVYPILTRHYSTEAFGLVAVYSALVAMIVTISSLRYEFAIPLPEDDQKAFNVAGLALYQNAATAVIFGVIFTIFPDGMRHLLGGRDVPNFVAYLVPFGVLLAGSYQVFSMWAVRKKDYKVLATTKITQQGTTSAIQLLGAFLLPSGFVLVASGMLGSGVGITSISTRTIKGKGLKLPKVKAAAASAKKYWQFAVMGAPAALFNTISTESRALLMAALYSLSATGQFSLAMRAIAVPISLLSSSIERVFFGEISTLGKSQPRKIRHLVAKFTVRVLLLGSLPTAVLFIWGPWLFTFAFGEQWLLAGEFARWLSLYMLTTMVASPFTSIFLLFEKQHVSLFLYILKAALAVASFVVPHALGASALTAVKTYTILLSAFYILLGLSARLVLRQATTRSDAGIAGVDEEN